MNAADAVKSWETACSSMRSRLLTIPQTALTTAGLNVKQAEIVRDLVYEALEALSGRRDADYSESDEPAPSLQAKPKKPLPAGHKKSGRPPRR